MCDASNVSEKSMAIPSLTKTVICSLPPETFRKLQGRYHVPVKIDSNSI